MKKIFFLLSFVVVFQVAALAQTDTTSFNLKSKRGFYYFPEKGDWSISISATPFFNYFSSLVGDKNINVYNNYGSYSYQMYEYAPTFAFTAQNPGSLFFKYFKEDNMAYRIKFLFGYTNEKDKLGTGNDDPQEIYLKQTAIAFGLSFGQEYYRPIKSRIRGYYGYEAGFYTLPYSGTIYNSNQPVVGKAEFINNQEPNQDFTEKGGSTFGLSGAAFIGAEWFFAPKISLGGEFGIGLNLGKQSERKHEQGANKIIVDSGGNNFSFEPYASGDLILHIYF